LENSFAMRPLKALLSRWLEADGSRTVSAADVRHAYEAILGRKPESKAIVEGWVGRPIETLYLDLVGSQEFGANNRKVTTNDVVLAYRALLNRPPESQHVIDNWAGRNLDELYASIAHSAEFVARVAANGPMGAAGPASMMPAREFEPIPSGDAVQEATSPEFREFLAANRLGLMRLNQYGTAYLWSLYQMLNELLTPDMRFVVEFGSGASTLILQELIASKVRRPADDLCLLSIDHIAEWQRLVSQHVRPSRFTHFRTYDLVGYCEHTSDGGFNYATAPLMLGRPIDLALVDGRTRAQCALAVASRLAPEGAVILDDAQRERYGFVDRYFHSAEPRGRFKILRRPVVAAPVAAKAKGAERRAIVRIVGGRQAEIEARITRASVERYARRCGAELLDIAMPEDGAAMPATKLAARETIAAYDRVALMDCDIVIRPGAPDVFAIVPDTHIGAVREDRHIDRAPWLDEMAKLYGVPVATDDGDAPYFNSGMLVLSRAQYELIRFPATGALYLHPLFEQTYLNARLRQLGLKLCELPKEFNMIRAFDPHHDADWRFGWFLHLAGSWFTGEWFWGEFWDQIDVVEGASVRRRDELLFRHVRIPFLRAVAAMAEEGRALSVFVGPNFKCGGAARPTHLPQWGVVGIDLAGAGEKPVAAGPYAELPAGSYRGEIRLLGDGARKRVTIDARSTAGACLLEKVSLDADADGVARFAFKADTPVRLELRFWPAASGVFLESVTLEAEAPSRTAPPPA
jgi:hypothetical protein